jgi:hypothetical protein
MSEREDNYYRHLVQTFVFLGAVPAQAAAIWVHPFNTFLDWVVLGALCLLAWAHIDTPFPDPPG